jgi:hypothetical protein
VYFIPWHSSPKVSDDRLFGNRVRAAIMAAPRIDPCRIADRGAVNLKGPIDIEPGGHQRRTQHQNRRVPPDG